MHEPPETGFNQYRPSEIPPELQTPPEPSKLGKFLSACAHAVFYVILFVGCQSFVVSAYLSAFITGDPAALTEPDTLNLLLEQVSKKTVLILLISNLLTILLVCVLMRVRRRIPAWEMELYPVNPFRLYSFALFGAAMNTFVSVTMSMLPLPEELLAEHSAQTMSLYGEMPLWVEIFSVAVVTGIAEEIIFRGLVISRLKKGMCTAAAVVISSIIFGFAHGSVLAVMYAALLGLLLGALYARYHSILPGMIFHIFFNMMSYWLPEEGAVLTILYILSIIAIPYCIWRIFIRFPVFNDVFTDVRDRIRPINEEEAAIVAQVKQHQKQGMITAEELQSLHDRWEDNRKAVKKEKRRRK